MPSSTSFALVLLIVSGLDTFLRFAYRLGSFQPSRYHIEAISRLSSLARAGFAFTRRLMVSLIGLSLIFIFASYGRDFVSAIPFRRFFEVSHFRIPDASAIPPPTISPKMTSNTNAIITIRIDQIYNAGVPKSSYSNGLCSHFSSFFFVFIPLFFTSFRTLEGLSTNLQAPR